MADVDVIADYISRENPDAADRVVDQLFERAESLARHPNLYRAGRMPGTRELVALPNYILVYRVEVDLVRILSVIHASRQYPPA